MQGVGIAPLVASIYYDAEYSSFCLNNEDLLSSSLLMCMSPGKTSGAFRFACPFFVLLGKQKNEAKCFNKEDFYLLTISYYL